MPLSEAGFPLGTLRPSGVELRGSWEDVATAIMAPRSGKTTGLAIPIVLDAPGATLCTSNKADVWAATAALRQEITGERVWVFDPQRIAYEPQTWWWNPLGHVRDYETAYRLAGHFVQEIRGDKDQDFWSSAAQDLISALLLAAAVACEPITSVYEWLIDPGNVAPSKALRTAGHSDAASSLDARRTGAVETRDGIYETARAACTCLRNEGIRAWITPPRPAGDVEQFDAARFVLTRESLYLLSKDTAGGAAPLVAALTDRVMEEATFAAERRGGRLDPPLTVVLDEAANICRIRDLPALYSHLGSRGVVVLTIIQSRAQARVVWGKEGFDSLWGASTVKIVGAGIDDAELAEELSRLVGDHDVSVRSVSMGRQYASESTSLRQERVLPAAAVRAMPKGTALLFATGCKPASLQLAPWYEGPRRREIEEAIRAATERLTAAATAANPAAR